MRRLTLTVVLALGLSSCAGFVAIDRRDWVLVWTDESVSIEMVNGSPVEVVKPAPGARQEVIPLERYDSEVADGRRHKAAATVGAAPKLLSEVKEPIELAVAEVRELRVEEPQEATVMVAGGAVKAYWTKPQDVSDGQSARKESTLFLLADEPGSVKVKLMYSGKKSHVVQVTVTDR